MNDLDNEKRFSKLFSYVDNLASDPSVTPYTANNDSKMFTFDENENDSVYEASLSEKKLGVLEQFLGLGNGGWWFHPKKFGQPYQPDHSDDLEPSTEQMNELGRWLRDPFNTEPILSNKRALLESINVLAMNSDEQEPKTPFTRPPKSAGPIPSALMPKKSFANVMPQKSNLPRRVQGTYDVSDAQSTATYNRDMDMSSSLEASLIAQNRNLARRDTFQGSGNFLKRNNYQPEQHISNSYVIDEEDENSQPLLTPKPSQNPQLTRTNLNVPQMARTFSNGELNKMKNTIDLKSSCEINVRSSNDSLRDRAKREEANLKSSVGSKYRSPSESKNNSRENLASSNPDFSKTFAKMPPNVSYDKIPNFNESTKSTIHKAMEQEQYLKSQILSSRRKVNSKSNDLLDPSFERSLLESSTLSEFRNIRSESETRGQPEVSNSGSFFGSSYNDNDISIKKSFKVSPHSSLEPAKRQEEQLREQLRNFKNSKTSISKPGNSYENLKDSRDSSVDKNPNRSYDIIPPQNLTHNNSLNNSINDMRTLQTMRTDSDGGIVLRNDRKLNLSTETIDLQLSYTKMLSDMNTKPPLPKSNVQPSGVVTGYREPVSKSRIPAPSKIQKFTRPSRPQK